MSNQCTLSPPPPRPRRPRALSAVLLCPLLLPAVGQGAPVPVAGVPFNTANATSTAIIVSGGYSTDHGNALHSGTSPSWTIADSLGTRFLVPTFQSNYSAATPNRGLAGSAVTLGHDANFPQTSSNPRDAIQLGWGAGFGLANQSGKDLAIFEAATSEAFGVRLYLNALGWTNWRYTPDQNDYDGDNDATATLIEFDDFNDFDQDEVWPGAVVTAIQICNLLVDDRVDTQILGTPLADAVGQGTVYFNGAAAFKPGRYSTSQGKWVPFEPTKFDPDIQYVVGLHDLTAETYDSIPAATFTLPLSPLFAPATQAAAPAPSTLALMLALLGWPWWRSRQPRRELAV